MLRDDICNSVQKVTKSGSFKVKFMVGSAFNRSEVCRKRYIELFNRGHTFLDSIIREIKDNVKLTQTDLNDDSGVPSIDTVKYAKK
jgi:hypothetical protein